MKTDCKFENYFEGYYSGELSPAEELALQKHLLTCSSCSKKIDEFYIVHSKLEMYQRPAPPEEVVESYYQQVNLSYGRESISQEFKTRGAFDLLSANLQRAKESVRVLEEFLKVVDRDQAERFKKIRFKIYNIEKVLIEIV